MNSTRRPGRFFGLVLALSAPVYALGALVPALNRVLPFGLPVGAALIVAPSTVALWQVGREEGSAGVRALLRRTLAVKWQRQWRWLLVSVLFMPAVVSISYLVQRGLGQNLPPIALNWAAFPAQFALFFVSAIAEELGWTGYAIDPLQARYGALGGGLLLGAFWALWHVIPYVQMGHTAPWVVGQCVGSVAARVVMVWIYNNAGKSVLSAVLFHTMLNVSEFSFPDHGSHYDPVVSGLVLVGLTLLVTSRQPQPG